MRSFAICCQILCCWVPASAADDNVWSPELSMRVETIETVIPSPDGKWVAYTRTSAVMEREKSQMATQIYLASADGARRFQLTVSEQSARSPAFSPDSKHLYFLSPRSGDLNIWRIAIEGGEAQRLTEWEGDLGSFRVSPDGAWLAFKGRKKDADFERAKEEKLDFVVVGENTKNDQLWITSAGVDADAEPKRICDLKSHVADFEWSPDSKRIVIEHWPRREPDYWLRADISELDLETSAVRTLAADDVSERSPRYSPSGKHIAYVRSSHANNWAGEGRLVLIDRAGGEPKVLPVTQDEFGRGSNLLGFSNDSKRLFFTETRGTRNVLMTMTLDGEQSVLLHPRSGTLASYGRGSHLNQTGTHIGFARESSAEAVKAYLLNLADGLESQVSEPQSSLPSPSLGRTEVIRWTSKDGSEIEGLLTYPVGYSEGTQVPLVLVIHGGPMGVFTETFIGRRGLYPIATFAAKGYAVLRPNPRGSSGYGKKFRMANFSDWGGGDYQDIMAGVDKVIDMRVADPTRMAVMGWSYGGFMTSWVIGHTDRFQAACVGAAVTNLWSFTGTSDILDFLPGYFGGEPWDVFESYREHSPMSYVRNVTTPTLVLHGEQDLRVPVSQGYELYNALTRRGVKAKMVVYPRTPHGPTEPKFLLDVARRHVGWVEDHLNTP
jgi:dipeptidyl aminopeptidase/acylaminoacyl peptidase